jgi:hypothetical protein
MARGRFRFMPRNRAVNQLLSGGGAVPGPG